MRSEASDGTDSRVGLCSVCRHARVIESGKGARFYLCEVSRTDPHYPRYPRLPVRECAAHDRRPA